MSPLRIEPDAGVYPAAWCSCGAQWLTGGIAEFFEGGLLHGRANCWPRPRAAATLDLQQALDVTFPCCWHCPCTGLQHVTACTVPGCEGAGGLMTPRLTFTPAEVDEFQPRAQHFIHEHGYFHSVEFMAWIDRQIAALCAPLDLPPDPLTRRPAAHLRWQGAQEAFDAFLRDRCPVCGPSGGAS